MKTGTFFIFALVVLFSTCATRNLPTVSDYYQILGRIHNDGRETLVASRVPKMDRNCFFSPVQCMFETPPEVLNNFR
ncbi:unnamed protein product [Caenorhabditis angaria]|uniref:Lipoprotein n=1 Tax=Caenorhabditis angaria TaxID=860376 RepID=A0A9P1IQW3_9PELO|nr:unnamed protein product [Caenorhabditis angaria]